MLKNQIFSVLCLTLGLAACQKPTEEVSAAEATSTQTDAIQTTQAAFTQSDEKIGHFLDQLDATNTSIKEKTQILCQDYPQEYKNHYMPAMLKLAAQDYTQEKMLNDLQISIDYYSEKLNITCSK